MKAALLALSVLPLLGCPSTYCQGGAKGLNCSEAMSAPMSGPPNQVSPAENPAAFSGPGGNTFPRQGPATPPQERSAPPQGWQ